MPTITPEFCRTLPLESDLNGASQVAKVMEQLGLAEMQSRRPGDTYCYVLGQLNTPPYQAAIIHYAYADKYFRPNWLPPTASAAHQASTNSNEVTPLLNITENAPAVFDRVYLTAQEQFWLKVYGKITMTDPLTTFALKATAGPIFAIGVPIITAEGNKLEDATFAAVCLVVMATVLYPVMYALTNRIPLLKPPVEFDIKTSMQKGAEIGFLLSFLLMMLPFANKVVAPPEEVNLDAYINKVVVAAIAAGAFMGIRNTLDWFAGKTFFEMSKPAVTVVISQLLTPFISFLILMEAGLAITSALDITIAESTDVTQISKSGPNIAFTTVGLPIIFTSVEKVTPKIVSWFVEMIMFLVERGREACGGALPR